jgi:hypothetical protein
MQTPDFDISPALHLRLQGIMEALAGAVHPSRRDHDFLGGFNTGVTVRMAGASPRRARGRLNATLLARLIRAE